MIFVLDIIIILLTLFLGLFVYKRNPKNLINIYFLFFCFSAVLWIIALLFSDFFKDINQALFWGRFSIIGAALLPYSFLLFVHVFPNIKEDFKLSKKIIFFIPVLFIILLFPTKYNIEKVVIHNWGSEAVIGSLYYFLLIYFVVYLFSAFRRLYKNFKKSTGLLRLQLIYIFLGLGIGFSIGVFTNLLSFYIGLPQSSIFGPISALVMVIFIAYAIVRYRLMDVRVIIRRSAVFTVIVLIITALYAILSYLFSVFFTELIGIQSVILNGIGMAILVALGFEPLKRFLSEITDSFLFKAEYKPQEVLSEFSDKLASTLNLNVLSQFMVARLNAVLKTTFVSLFLLDEEKKEYIKVAESGKIVEKVNYIDKNLFARVYKYLVDIGKAKDVLVREEIKKINEQAKSPVLGLLIREFEKYEVNLMAPFYLQEKLIGILFLGDKKSGDVYSQEDLRVLEIIASQSAVSINNAKLFEEQKHFAEHLKKEVDKATKELKIANIQLRKLDKAKSEFISIASHQLRTPLTVIRGYISMIEQGDFGIVSLKVKEPLDRVYKSTMRIIGLVEDLLNISRIESGRLKYDFKPTDLTALVSDVYEELKQQAKNKGLQFDFAKSEKEIPQIMLDEGKIREVIMNLTDNAIKYTDSGFVRIKLARDNDHVTFSVSDSGRGLDTDEIPLLFQKFSRAKGAQLMHTEGTGLGLYIAKNIIAKHGGKIWVESPGVNKGATFYIRFKINNKRLEK